MAKSASEISLDYNQAVGQADSLNEMARELRNAANVSIQECISGISGCWTGSNSAAYVKKCSQLKSDVLSTAAQLERTAAAVRTIAKNTYNAEMQALRLAQLRNYS
ncbi:MAG: hypothetical protein LUG99_02585 [Lachnospiraceae bacterium]|nr:hypothetical protein [Lachnospiraceae bacterium]